MTLKKLPSNVQTLFCVSTQVNSYRKAVEELVYNSLDAKSTSIAVRVHIEDGKIQVIDNGHGVTNRDLSLLGQRYMTSKFFDLCSFKSAPNYYGFHGESLANIIKISQTVKVTSRHEHTDETWCKTFKNGNNIELTKLTTRPSKGTTVEVNGFLYNLRIQKKATDSLTELQDIKTFLEQLSLVHSNISLSLRDDSKNEIIFSIHKNRDIYQTLNILFGIHKTDIQELQVEKHQYKVKAFIGNGGKEIGQHYVYLNGKFISFNNRLHKIVNKNIKNLTKKKSKNFKYDDEHWLSQYKIPFYFILITCPYMDYDVSNTPKKTILEFKNWDQINNLLEKLIKFYGGDINLKEVPLAVKKQAVNDEQVNMARNQVKKIMDKILGSHSKKLQVSQMKNGIRGKQIKRRSRKKSLNICLSKIIPPKQNNKERNNITTFDDQPLYNFHLDCNLPNNNLNAVNKEKDKITAEEETLLSKRITKSHCNNNAKKSKLKKILMQNQLTPNKVMFTTKQKLLYHENKAHQNNNKTWLIKDPLITKFAMPTESVRKRHKILAENVDKLLDNKNKRKRNFRSNETVQFSSVVKCSKNISIRHKYDEIVIHDYEPISPKIHTKNIYHNIWDNLEKKTFRTTYDLVHTVLKSQQEGNLRSGRIDDSTSIQNFNESCRYTFRSTNDKEFNNTKNIPVEYRLTFESHNCHKKDLLKMKTENDNFNNFDEKTRTTHFITVQSRENFVAPNDGQNYKNLRNKRFQSEKNKLLKNIFTSNYPTDKNHFEETSYTIEFTNSNEIHKFRNNNELVASNKISLFTDYEVNSRLFCKRQHIDDIKSNHKPILINGNTYTITQNIDDNTQEDHCGWNKNGTYVIESANDRLSRSLGNEHNKLISGTVEPILIDEPICDKENNFNAEDISMSQCSDSNSVVEIDRNLDPINICETILDRPDLLDKEFEFSFNVYNNIQSEFQQNNYFDNNFAKEHYLFIPNEENSRKITETQNIPETVSRHFNSVPNYNNLVTENTEVRVPSPILTSQVTNRIHGNEKNIDSLDKRNHDMEFYPINYKFEIQTDFNFKDRLRFLPKGMSPICENCHTKDTCRYSLDKEYYEDSIYNNFANNVQVNSEVFKPRIQNVSTTRNIEKVNHKINEDKASLKFDGQSIKKSKVLGQVDEKFIAAIIKTKCNESNVMSEFLVLFDQHAVHERIRLEKNMSDYFKYNKWLSIPLDEILLKSSKDELLYLHNYTDKFTQLGLQWTIVNDKEISLNAIPEAILGKNPRQVEKVIKAVKNLITEEMNNIKLQRGYVSIYPKSIMDLVFSEACRYAIKFGDKLTKDDCMVLLNELSDCKTPFQCAHGRPLMAVIMDIKCGKREYKVNIANLRWLNKETK